MGVLSADPDKLHGFVETKSARTALEELRGTVQGLNQASAAASDYPVHPKGLGSLGTVITNGFQNEEFVSLIERNLREADSSSGSVGGVVSIDSSAVAASLKEAGLTEPPPLVVTEPTTSIGVPQSSGYADDPVNAFNGNFVHVEHDVGFVGVAATVEVVRAYNSLQSDLVGAFGPGWSSVFETELRVGADGFTRIAIADGGVLVCSSPIRGVPSRVFGRGEWWLHVVDEGWELREPQSATTWRFNPDGVLTGWTTGVARVSTVRDEGRLVGLRELSSGRELSVEWADDRVVSVTTSDGRTCRYSYNDEGVLVGVTTPTATASYEVDGTLLMSMRDADGVVLFTNTFDNTGRITGQRSQFGRDTAWEYDDDLVTRITGDDGIVNVLVHDNRGQLIAAIDGDGHESRFTYDAWGHRSGVIDRAGNMTLFNFDAEGRLVGRVDPDGLTQRYEWDDQSRLISEIDRAGAMVRYEYEGEARTPSRMINALGAVTEMRLGALEQLVETVDPDGVVTRFEWNRDGLLVGVTTGVGATIEFAYDEAGELVRTVDASGVATELVLDPAGRVTRMLRAGVETSYDYSPAGRHVAGVEPGDVPWAVDWNEHGLMAGIRDGAGSRVAFSYDNKANMVAVTAPDGAVYRQMYDEVGRLVAVEGPDGAGSTREYDANGIVVALIDGEGRRWERTVNSFGQTVSSAHPDGAVSTTTYHPGGRVATVTLPDGRVWSHEVDLLGRTTAVVNPAGDRSEIGYTPGGRVAWRRSPEGREERYEYDAAGRCVVVVGIDGIRRELSLDEQGRITRLVEGDTATTAGVRWGPNGVEAVVGENGSFQLERDSGGRVVSSTDADGVRTEFEFDVRGLLSQIGTVGGDTTSVERDIRGRVIAELFESGRRVDYGYDLTGFADAVTDSEATTRVARDRSGRIIETIFADGSGWAERLDASGRVVERVTTDGGSTRFDYDTVGRLIGVTDAAGRVGLMWDDADALVGVDRGSGVERRIRDRDGWLVEIIEADGRTITFDRNRYGSITGYRVDGEPVDLSDADLERDAAGRIVADRHGRVFRYDVAGRLHEQINANGAITTYTYDPISGLLVNETGPTGTIDYEYDHTGRITSRRTPDGIDEYDYDTRGRRIQDRRADGAIMDYQWSADGDLTAIGITDTFGTTSTVEVIRDPLGAVTRFGDVADTRWPVAPPDRSDVWASPLGVTNHDITIIGARAYQTSTRQWLSPDPLPTVAGTGGAGSAYTYCWYDPINFVDPTGLRPLSDAEYQEWNASNEQGAVTKVNKLIEQRLDQAWEAIKNDPWGTLAMVGVVAVGVGLMFVPGGQAIGAGILIGAAMSGGVGLATGNFNPRDVAIGGVLGGLGAGVGQGVGMLAQNSGIITRTLAAGLADSGVDAFSQYVTTGSVDPRQVALSGVTGAAGNLGGEAVTALRNRPNTSVTSAVDIGDVTPSSTSNVNVFHATDGADKAQSILNGIDPKYLNDDARFGAAFYAAESPDTALAEVAHHGVTPSHGIRFEVDMDEARVLDLTDPRQAEKWGYTPGLDSYESTQGLTQSVKAMTDYNVIRFPSARGDGANLAVIDDFNDVLKPQMVTPTGE